MRFVTTSTAASASLPMNASNIARNFVITAVGYDAYSAGGLSISLLDTTMSVRVQTPTWVDTHELYGHSAVIPSESITHTNLPSGNDFLCQNLSERI